jgi:dTDP-4-dehydrorhamnose reductase
MRHDTAIPGRLPLWGALDCTVDHVLDAYFTQLERNGCRGGQRDDLERCAALGIEALRYPLPWERIAPHGLGSADWSWPDRRLATLRRLRIAPILGLVYNGALPRQVSLYGRDFGWQLAQYATVVARRYPWVEHYTPVATPQVTASFVAADESRPARGQDEHAFVHALVNQCRAVALAMRAIRSVNPRARLIQTEEPGKAWGTPAMAALTALHNERRWLTWDLLCGHVDRHHPLWDYLAGAGIATSELLWFRDHPCAPDLLGVQHDVASERWFDHRGERFPPRCLRTFAGSAYADSEAVRALATPPPGIAALLLEAWERYRLPLALTEARIDANREDQLRWLLEMWQGACEARARGADVRALAVYPLLGCYDWRHLASRQRGSYDAGAFAVRGAHARPTALAQLVRELADGRAPSSAVLAQPGWWRAPARLHCQPVASNSVVAELSARRIQVARQPRPILVAGALGQLGSAFGRICAKRNLACVLLSRQELDIASPAAVTAALERYRPWALVNAAGQSCVDQAQLDPHGSYRDNVHGPTVLAFACARHGVRLLSFSSDQVFDGRARSPYVESDRAAPLNLYGQAQAAAERNVLQALGEALLVRTSALFGPWDGAHPVARALAALAAGEEFAAADDVVVSPTYVPDLVHACLDLLIDNASGIWHLSNCEPLSWFALMRRAGAHAGIDAAKLRACPFAQLPHAAQRPAFSPLYTEKEVLLPPLEDALARYVQHRVRPVEQDSAGQAARYSN